MSRAPPTGHFIHWGGSAGGRHCGGTLNSLTRSHLTKHHLKHVVTTRGQFSTETPLHLHVYRLKLCYLAMARWLVPTGSVWTLILTSVFYWNLLYRWLRSWNIRSVYSISCWPYTEFLRLATICMTPWYCYPTLSHQHYSYRRNLISCRNADNILGCFAVMLHNFDLFKENIQQFCTLYIKQIKRSFLDNEIRTHLYV